MGPYFAGWCHCPSFSTKTTAPQLQTALLIQGWGFGCFQHWQQSWMEVQLAAPHPRQDGGGFLSSKNL
jgi:hypothetical protein